MSFEDEQDRVNAGAPKEPNPVGDAIVNPQKEAELLENLRVLRKINDSPQA